MGEIIRREDIAATASDLRAAGLRLVLTNGCFDLLHVGHLRYLRAARALGDVLMVGVNDDRSVTALKGEGRPLMPAGDRVELIAGLVPVDYAFVFPELTAGVLLAEIRPAVYAKGGDYLAETLPEAAAAEACGAQLAFIPLTPERSTTRLAAGLGRLRRDGDNG